MSKEQAAIDLSNTPNKVMFGFWQSDYHPQFPPAVATNNELQTYLIAKLRAIETQALVISYRGYSHCRLCDRRHNGTRSFVIKIGAHVYEWPEGFVHYLEDHRVDVPPGLMAMLQDPASHDIAGVMAINGYYAARMITGVPVALHDYFTTTGLVVGLNAIGYERRYCYKTQEEAVAALSSYKSVGTHPSGMWVKIKGMFNGQAVDYFNPEFLKEENANR